MLSRAVHLDIATDYDTESFLLVTRRFMAMRGSPMKIYSDPGSQLKAANKELQDALNNLNKRTIEEFGVTNRIEWIFGSPDAPWRNGCTEALIKSVKRSITAVIGDQVLPFSEMQTTLYEVANLINSRPIGSYPTTVDDGVYLSPNDLLLGRSNSQIPSGPFNETTNKYLRHKFISKLTESFWRKWNAVYFPSLLIHPKWHTKHRNIKVGDIVMIQDSGMIKGRWKIGKVVKSEPSTRDGSVRTVDIQYKNPESNTFVTISRPVQRLVVILPVEQDDDSTTQE